MGEKDTGAEIIPPEEMSGYTYTLVNVRISGGACVLYGVNVENGAVAGVATLHEGRNALAPIIMAINAPIAQGAWRLFPKGIELDRGLFVALDANVVSVTVLWRPRREREAG